MWHVIATAYSEDNMIKDKSFTNVLQRLHSGMGHVNVSADSLTL